MTAAKKSPRSVFSPEALSVFCLSAVKAAAAVLPAPCSVHLPQQAAISGADDGALSGQTQEFVHACRFERRQGRSTEL